ncbi:hypothetical protein C8R45DRAFT_420520 [Mycena sanguinolenta]|nr:hypothetical protein C8R45DRAFT_420520 [Mycena sanguinolenta]
MSICVLNTLEPSEKPAPGSICSLVFSIPFPEDTPSRFLAHYQVLKTERQLQEESNFGEASAKLALEAYFCDDLRTQRERWCERATATFDSLVQANKKSIRHVELILPTGGMATPLNLCMSLKDITQLESFCVQWPLRGYTPLTFLLTCDWSHILSSTLIPSYSQFYNDLTSLLATHATTLKHLRISLPQSTTRLPFSALSIDAKSFPALSALEILDLTHWSPRVPDIIALLSPSKLPNLRHLILDHGAELSVTDEDEEGLLEEQTYSWVALGTHLSAHKDKLKLRSLSAALHDMRGPGWPVAMRLTTSGLHNALEGGSGLEELALCTAWPVDYSAHEPTLGGVKKGDEDLYAHTPGCGHLAFPLEHRPTTGLWPAQTEEGRAMEVLKGRPWC